MGEDQHQRLNSLQAAPRAARRPAPRRRRPLRLPPPRARRWRARSSEKPMEPRSSSNLVLTSTVKNPIGASGQEVIRTSACRSGQTGLLGSTLLSWRSLMALRDLRIVRNKLSCGHRQQRRKPSPGSTCVYAAQTSDGPMYESPRLIAQPAPCRSTLSCGSSPATPNNPPPANGLTKVQAASGGSARPRSVRHVGGHALASPPRFAGLIAAAVGVGGSSDNSGPGRCSAARR